jgi:hypothetical protein
MVNIATQKVAHAALFAALVTSIDSRVSSSVVRYSRRDDDARTVLRGAGSCRRGSARARGSLGDAAGICPRDSRAGRRGRQSVRRASGRRRARGAARGWRRGGRRRSLSGAPVSKGVASGLVAAFFARMRNDPRPAFWLVKGRSRICAPVGIRTPNLLIRRSRLAVRPCPPWPQFPPSEAARPSGPVSGSARRAGASGSQIGSHPAVHGPSPRTLAPRRSGKGRISAVAFTGQFVDGLRLLAKLARFIRCAPTAPRWPREASLKFARSLDSALAAHICGVHNEQSLPEVSASRSVAIVYAGIALVESAPGRSWPPWVLLSLSWWRPTASRLAAPPAGATPRPRFLLRRQTRERRRRSLRVLAFPCPLFLHVAVPPIRGIGRAHRG